MGCNGSKLDAIGCMGSRLDEQEAVALCRGRADLLAAAARHCDTLAAAHAALAASLASTSSSLHLLLLSASASSAQPRLTLPAAAGKSVDPLVTTTPDPPFGYYPPPLPPRASSWDFFNVFDGYDVHDNYCYDAGAGDGHGTATPYTPSRCSREVREEEGIPDLTPPCPRLRRDLAPRLHLRRPPCGRPPVRCNIHGWMQFRFGRSPPGRNRLKPYKDCCSSVRCGLVDGNR